VTTLVVRLNIVSLNKFSTAMKFSKLFLLLLFVFLYKPLKAQYVERSPEKVPNNWFNLDYQEDGVRGISTEKAYREILKNKTSKPVLIAIIDSGVDVTHEDLKGKIWVNPNEIPNNGIDDDGNGYIDDINGWDFLGGKDGKDVDKESLEVTREYARLRKTYQCIDDTSKLSIHEKENYRLYEKYKNQYEAKVSELRNDGEFVINFYQQYTVAKQLISKHLKVQELTKFDLEKIGSKDSEELKKAKKIVEILYKLGEEESKIKDAYEYYNNQLIYGVNLNFDPRGIIGDDVNNPNDRNYGNNEVKGPDAHHGTHVAGIIAANRENDLGVAGIANNVQIMVVRAIPEGDERDKDIANAILYAVNNGAKVINMSFGKTLSPQKYAVDYAVKYAQSKGVLLIHAAGNENENIDKCENYPSKFLIDGSMADNWLEVGATTWMQSPSTVATFSNYGQKTVDIFAPGFDIKSTVVDSKYEELSGTSMAAPVVTGLVALILSYYPELDYKQVKNIVLNSSTKLNHLKVLRPGSNELVEFGQLSNSGGIVNAFSAIMMAEKEAKTNSKNQ
jgi:subtilisin family serine protease